jgi:hypothetical protein
MNAATYGEVHGEFHSPSDGVGLPASRAWLASACECVLPRTLFVHLAGVLSSSLSGYAVCLVCSTYFGRVLHQPRSCHLESDKQVCPVGLE